MSNVSTFITEMEAKRIYGRRMRKLAWCIQIISVIIFALSSHILNNTEAFGFGTALLCVAVSGLISGCVLHQRFSMWKEVR